MEESGLQVRVSAPYEQAIEMVTAALKEQGFGVLTEIDVKATLKKKLAVDFRKYAILGACNPPLAHRALAHDLDVGLLLPCNVIVYEDGNGAVVKLLDPVAMLSVGGTDEPLQQVAREARQKLEKVVEALSR